MGLDLGMHEVDTRWLEGYQTVQLETLEGHGLGEKVKNWGEMGILLGL